VFGNGVPLQEIDCLRSMTMVSKCLLLLSCLSSVIACW